MAHADTPHDMSGKPAVSGSQTVRILRGKVKDGTWKDIWKDWKWIWSFSRGRSGMIVLYTLFGLGSSALGLASGVVSKYLIDSIVAMDLSRLLVLIGLLLCTAIFSVIFRSMSSRFAAKLSITMHNDILAAVFDRLIASDWLSISKYSTGDLLNRFSGDISTVSSCAVSWIPNAIIQVFTVLATLGVILYYDPIMALIGCASTPLLFLASHRLIRKQRDYNRQMREATSNLSAFESEAFRNIDTLKSFGIEQNISRRLRQWQEKYRQVALDYNSFSIRTNAYLTALSTAVQYLALGYCLWQLWRGDILFGTMVLFLQQRSNLSSSFSSLISLIPTALSGSIAAERVRELTELDEEPRGSADTALEAPVESCCIRTRDLQVAYTADRKVLTDVNIQAGPGEIVALVGPSGEGKTTLLRLLLGLVHPIAGEAILEASSKKCYPLGADTRHCFAYVPQGNTIWAGTVADNLRLVNENATENEMIDALESACAWEFVRKMPAGLYSPIGEGGKGLSEGQAQRIAIARALMRKAPVMLLDEVTSALDQETEQRVLSRLMSRGVTCIVTTHRPSVLTMCSRAYRVEGNQVVLLRPEEIRAITMEK